MTSKAERRNRYWPFLAMTAIAAMAIPCPAATIDLYAKPGTVTMPNGAVVAIWGYSLTSGGAATVPGPRITVPPGDTTLEIVLHNALPEATSIVIPGLPSALSPVFVTDAAGRQRVRSFAAQTNPGGTLSYTWTGVKPGTYLYQSGTKPGKQVPMGLYGAVTQDYAASTAYPGTSYATEVLVFYSELDPGLTAAANVARPLSYNPRYFLVNGKPFDAANPSASTLAAGTTNQAVLLRLLNAGLKSHAPTLLGTHMKVVAEDGNPYPYPKERYTAFLAPGKTKDALWVPGFVGRYPLFDQFHSMSTNGALGGGLLSYLVVSASGAPPVAVPDSYTTPEDTALAVPAPGVLTGDTPAGSLSASLVTAPAHGTMSLSPNGGFTYTPAANYNGSDSFQYRVSDGSQYSNTVTDTITVTAVADAVTAVADSATTAMNTAVNVNVLANDLNPDGGTLTVTVVGAPASGTAVVQPNRTVQFTPTTGFTGTGSFSYMITDGVTSSTAAVTIKVNPNQPPVAADDAYTVPRNTNNNLFVLQNDSDPDGSLVQSTVRLAGGATTGSTLQGGTVTVNTATGRITYRSRRNFLGSDSFTYTVRDNLGAISNTARVRLTVVK